MGHEFGHEDTTFVLDHLADFHRESSRRNVVYCLPDAYRVRVTQTLRDAVASQIRRFRKVRGLSVRDLADRCAAMGAPQLTAASLSNIERGQVEGAKRRGREVSVEELLVLSAILGIPPTLLLAPVTSGEPVEVVPGRAVMPYDAVKWISGDAPLPGDDIAAWARDSDALAVLRIRLHEDAVQRYQRMLRSANHERALAASEADSERAQQHLNEAEEQEQVLARGLGPRVMQARAALHAAGITLPPLPSDVRAHFDRSTPSTPLYAEWLVGGDDPLPPYDELAEDHKAVLADWSAARERQLAAGSGMTSTATKIGRDRAKADHNRATKVVRDREADLRTIRRRMRDEDRSLPALPSELDGLDRQPRHDEADDDEAKGVRGAGR